MSFTLLCTGLVVGALAGCSVERLSESNYYGGTPDSGAADDGALVDTDGGIEPDSGPIPDTDGTDLPDTDGTDIPDADGTDAPDVDGVDTDGTHIPDTDGTDIPDTDGTDLPDTDGTDLPDTDIPDTDGTDTPDIEMDITTPDATGGDTEDTGPDVCLPDCVGKQCGDNGCGGLCGFCEVGQECNELFQCAKECVKACFQKFCGPDGCGGTCGTCEPGFECGPDGKCYDITCVPDCDGKLCGDDGCGNSCGECSGGDLCEEGLCVAGPCTGIPPVTGKCENNTAYVCVDGAATVSNCDSAADKICGWNPDLGHFACIEEPDCIPNCAGKDCGADGCGGLCGACPSQWPCANQICQPTAGGGCGYFNTIGTCEDNVLWYCDSDTLFSQDCSATGQTCAFSTQTNTNQCIN